MYSSHLLHLEKVEEGLAHLQSLGGQLNIAKCHIGESQVVLLGHVIFLREIEANPSKVQDLIEILPPCNAQALISFLQKVRYLARFIHLLSELAAPLQSLAIAETLLYGTRIIRYVLKK